MGRTKKHKIITMILAIILALGILLSIGAGVLYTFAVSDLEKQLNSKLEDQNATLESMKTQLSELDEEKAALDAKQDAIEANKQEVAAQISNIEDRLAVLEDRESSLLDEKSNTDELIAVTMNQINLTQDIIDELTLKIAARTRDLMDAEQQEASEYELFKTRVRAMSESSGLSTVEAIFSSSSLTDIFIRIQALADIARYDRNLMTRMAEVREYIAGLKEKLEEDQQDARDAQLKLEAYEAELEVQTNNLDSMLVRLDARTEESTAALEEAEALKDLYVLELEAAMREIDAKNAEIEAKNAEIQGQKDEIAKTQEAIVAEQKAEKARIEAERARKAAEEAARKAKEEEAARVKREAAAAAQAAAKAQSSSSGKVSSWTWPCPSSSKVTSGYGYRTHPITGEYKLHNGIDIAASKNAKIVAAAAGTVTTVAYSKGYGNYVTITHAGGIQTLYAHMTTATVKVGQTVSAGEQVGKVGMTGYATGYHLHFTVFVNGSTVNPRKYV